MEQIEIYGYYSFGYNYRILVNEHDEETNFICYDFIKDYIAFVDKLDLRVTKSAIALSDIQTDFEKLRKLAAATKTKGNTIDKALRISIVSKLKKIDSVLDAELSTKIAYILDEKRVSNEILLTKIGNLFSKNTFSRLPSIALFDFEESGKCLAFDRYTACAFHALRGTEDVLKMYFKLALAVTPKESDTWGTFENAIIKAIANNTLTPHPSEELVINISSLRKYYRNKTQHPQMTYSSDETQDLLSHCIKTVNELFADLDKRALL